MYLRDLDFSDFSFVLVRKVCRWLLVQTFFKIFMAKFKGRVRDRGLNTKQKAVNFEPCDLIKALEVIAEH